MSSIRDIFEKQTISQIEGESPTHSNLDNLFSPQELEEAL
jgi:hypothetical protein